MIGRLTGRVLSEGVDGTVLLDVGGVGYELLIPQSTLLRARDPGSERTVLHVHTHVREDALELYGFASELERRVFRLLLGVPNVGPRTALAVLSALPPPELARAVEAKDLARLNKITGVGKKTAERLAMELREKLPKLGAEPLGATEPPAPSNATRLLGALTNMGYRPAEAQRAVAALGDRVESEALEALIRAALAELSRL